MRKGFLVISGCPRSGTSVNMDIQRAVHGDEAICGHKFPQEVRQKMREEMLERHEDEPFHLWQCRRYLVEKQIAVDEAQLTTEHRRYRDMNPEGFYEMAFTVPGIIYKPQVGPLLAAIMRGDFRVVKVVSSGLLASDPSYIGKVIYAIRHPRAVAKSQERLIRGFSYVGEDGTVHNAFEDLVIHTPEMFIRATLQMTRFLLLHPRIPVRLQHFEDLIIDPDKALGEMGDFVGHGDYSKAAGIVQPRLDRSKHEDVESPLWKDAEFVYERFCEAAAIINDYDGEHWSKVQAMRRRALPALRAILEYMADPKRNFNREGRKWMCYRAKHGTNEAICHECRRGGDHARNFRKHSESIPPRLGVTKHWSEEPCLFECGYDLDRDEHLTIEESIANNSWEQL